MQALTKTAHNGTFSVKAGEMFSLTLDENPMTGYRWHLTCDRGLDLVSSDYTTHPGGAVGAGGVVRYLLSAPVQGRFAVKAELWRPWQDNRSAIDRCEFSIEVS
jgi:predicted secreted protein